MAEQGPYKAEVDGSNPSTRTIQALNKFSSSKQKRVRLASALIVFLPFCFFILLACFAKQRDFIAVCQENLSVFFSRRQ